MFTIQFELVEGKIVYARSIGMDSQQRCPLYALETKRGSSSVAERQLPKRPMSFIINYLL